LRGGVLYHDGQFDDTRLLIHLLATAVDHGATVVNYTEAVDFLRDEGGFVAGAVLTDREARTNHDVRAKVVVNATGIFTDDTRRLAQPGCETMVTPSQGIHLVLDRSFLKGDNAIMVPRTSDGRVLFAIPWHDRTLVGTTDTLIDTSSYEPLPLEEEIEFVLDTAREYLSRPPARADVLSIYVGIRPLVSAPGGGEGKTSALSRGHTIHVDNSGLVSIVGGKWTTYRHMAEDCVDHAITLGALSETPCVTADLKIHGYHPDSTTLGALGVYGSDADGVLAIANERADYAARLHPELPYIAAEIVWGVRHEMSRTLDDALARRTRALLLNARASIAIAPRVAALMAAELGRDAAWIAAQVSAFTALARQYVLEPVRAPSVATAAAAD
jgi:glycerol-3-phosphate dehydrogenase